MSAIQDRFQDNLFSVRSVYYILVEPEISYQQQIHMSLPWRERPQQISNEISTRKKWHGVYRCSSKNFWLLYKSLSTKHYLSICIQAQKIVHFPWNFSILLVSDKMKTKQCQISNVAKHHAEAACDWHCHNHVRPPAPGLFWLDNWYLSGEIQNFYFKHFNKLPISKQ